MQVHLACNQKRVTAVCLCLVSFKNKTIDHFLQISFIIDDIKKQCFGWSLLDLFFHSIAHNDNGIKRCWKTKFKRHEKILVHVIDMGWFSSISNFFHDYNQSTSSPKPKYFLCTMQLNCSLPSFYIQCCPFPCENSKQNFTIINTDPIPPKPPPT